MELVLNAQSVVSGLILMLIAVIGYFLRQKDAAQENKIRKLFELHDADSKELQNHRIMIAENHYKKEELDKKFGEMRDEIGEVREEMRGGFGGLNDRLDRLNALLFGRLGKGEKD